MNVSIFKFMSLFGVLVLTSCAGKKTNDVSVQMAVNPGSFEDFKAKATNIVYFAFDKYNLTEEAKSALINGVAWLKMYDSVNVFVNGHADERGTDEYNIALGARRAESVKEFLKKNGISASRITTQSFGKQQPVALGNSEEDHALNRRVEIIVSEVN